MSRNKRGGRISATRGTPLILLVISLLILSISTKTIAKLPNAVISAISGGVQFLFSSIESGITKTVFSIRELRALRSQYDALAAKLESYATLERDYADTIAENQRLREQLGFSQNITAVKASARIIAKDPGNLYSSYTIDKGIQAGIKTNMAVAAFQEGIEGLAGKILSTRQNTSIVIPAYDQRFFVSGRFSRTRSEGLVNGQGNPEDPFIMKFVSKLNAADLQIGDLVVTSGLDSIYPEGLAIGRIQEIRLPRYSSSAEIFLKSALDFSKLEYLFVLEKSEIEPPSAESPGSTGSAEREGK